MIDKCLLYTKMYETLANTRDQRKRILHFRYNIRVHGHTDIPTNLTDF